MSTRDDLVLQTLEPATHDLGGFKVYRTLPHRERTMVGPFLFFDQMGPAHLPPGNGVDVRPHPHIGLSTVTYLFEGAFQHRDSLGSDIRITPGAVNLMTAGAGIVHSERSPDDVRVDGPRLDGIQTWLALPDGQEDRAPAFEHVAADKMPVVDAHGATARVVMGTLWGATSPVTAYAETIYADIMLAPGAAVPIDNSTDERAIYLASGEATLDGLALEPQRLYVLRPGVAATLRSQAGGRAMLAGGAAFATPRHVWWNFVHSSRDAIREARRAWKAGEFASVPDDSEWIPLPEVPKTVSYP
ncbi:pirin family protein [Sphingomonas sp. 8AM]|uniref:pirin family protein n=1 Tax=Sphingomonas sp. 8AM TaxID=2653170 RepID=UPI0012F01C74|nr:pirin family protein [Sphingomonas sp. 8AM]VXC79493.1 Pirin-like protein CC_3178 [Sphingomonas sp. 8AM]